jgi:valyl-tRNA synthetase
MISGIRNVKSRYGVAPGKRVPASVQIQDDAFRSAVISAEAYFVRLARVETLSVVENEQAAGTSVPVVGSRYALYLPMAGLVDLDAERTRLEQEIEQKTNYARSLEGKLQNEQFVSRAPEAVVAKERAKLAETVDELARLQKNLSDLQSN